MSEIGLNFDPTTCFDLTPISTSFDTYYTNFITDTMTYTPYSPSVGSVTSNHNLKGPKKSLPLVQEVYGIAARSWTYSTAFFYTGQGLYT